MGYALMRHLARAAAVLCMAAMACAQRPDVTYMLRPHEELPDGADGGRGFTKVFLAGTIDMGAGRDWQAEMYERFSGTEGRFIFFNPRQEHWDASRPGEMDYQENWELERLEEADFIIMYILGNSKSPISLLEMGLHARSGKLYIICEEDFYSHDNVRITCSRYGIPLFSSMESF
ncbi:MAG: nucleoside 2-deoxyribosyltransferase domain-containing protein, partial [Bacteroidales bacterium]|nr:nucleoside 2-deoxyribosyltransferase domain-containing protein [Bacteroidales bacterium]